MLSGDQVHSPVQMIIDDEIVSALQRFVRGFEVSDETLALDVMKAIGPGGNFMGDLHTARHYRSESWQPRLFTREALAGWQQHGARMDRDVAMDIYHDVVGREPLPVRISDSLERQLLDTIHGATGVAIPPVKPE